jgi:hypothetical protein
VVNVLTGESDAVPATARYYKSKGLPWVVVGEWGVGGWHVKEEGGSVDRCGGGGGSCLKGWEQAVHVCGSVMQLCKCLQPTPDTSRLCMHG